MNDYFTRFRESPFNFKKSFALLSAAWICHLLFLYSLFWGQENMAGVHGDMKRMVVVSLSLCFFLFLQKKWARALVVMGSCFIVVNDLIWFIVTPRTELATILCVIVVLFSIAGMYYLFARDVRDYFNRVNPKPESQSPIDS